MGIREMTVTIGNLLTFIGSTVGRLRLGRKTWFLYSWYDNRNHKRRETGLRGRQFQ
jgi:hypothetical protein